jgi:hypothetical protein
MATLLTEIWRRYQAIRNHMAVKANLRYIIPVSLTTITHATPSVSVINLVSQHIAQAGVPQGKIGA